jgi:regulator of replication initiation timing
MKNKSFIQKLSLLTLSLFFAGSLFGKTLDGNIKPESDLTNGLVAWYPLDGNASDMSGNGLNTIINGATLSDDRYGKSNGAFFFDGNDYIETEKELPIKGNSKRTISLWFKTDKGDNSYQALVSTGNNGTSRLFDILFRKDHAIVHYYGHKNNFNAGTIKLNQWHLLTVTHDSVITSLFIDGILKSSRNNILNTSPNKLIIGATHYNYDPRGPHISATASIDDVRIYDRALSEEEVLALYELESISTDEDRPTPPPVPGNGELTPPDPDYKDTIAELMRLLAEKDKKLAHCEKEMAAKNKEIETLQGKVSGLEKQVSSLETNNEELRDQIQNLREDNQNLNYEITVTNEHLQKAIQVAETPFINGWVYDPERGWLFTDADRFPLIYTHKDQTWHYYELGSSKPRYFFNYKSQEWVAWDAIPSESDQVVANR